jgi:hypothetical protein
MSLTSYQAALPRYIYYDSTLQKGNKDYTRPGMPNQGLFTAYLNSLNVVELFKYLLIELDSPLGIPLV